MTKRTRHWYQELVHAVYDPDAYDRIADKMERDLTAEESDEVYDRVYQAKRNRA
jgi:hypothetical protein